MAKIVNAVAVILVLALGAQTAVDAFSFRALPREAGDFLEVDAGPREKVVLEGGRVYDPQEFERKEKVENCVASAVEGAEKKAEEERKKVAVAVAKCRSENQGDVSKSNDCIEKLNSEAIGQNVRAELELKSKKEACRAANPKRCPPSPKCCILLSFGKPCPCEIKEKGKVCKQSQKAKVAPKDGEVLPITGGKGPAKK